MLQAQIHKILEGNEWYEHLDAAAQSRILILLSEGYNLGYEVGYAAAKDIYTNAEPQSQNKSNR